MTTISKSIMIRKYIERTKPNTPSSLSSQGNKLSRTPSNLSSSMKTHYIIIPPHQQNDLPRQTLSFPIQPSLPIVYPPPHHSSMPTSHPPSHAYRSRTHPNLIPRTPSKSPIPRTPSIPPHPGNEKASSLFPAPEDLSNDLTLSQYMDDHSLRAFPESSPAVDCRRRGRAKASAAGGGGFGGEG